MINFINRFHVKDDEERLYVESPAPYETNTFFSSHFKYFYLSIHCCSCLYCENGQCVVYGGSQRFKID